MPTSHLWVLCLDDEAERQLQALNLPGLSPIPLSAFETPSLLRAKENRSRIEYIYTLTPFTFDHVFAAADSARRVTYVDADLFFFRSPIELLDDFEASGASVLATEHGFSPEYRHLERESGRFCVQFLTFVRDDAGARVLRDWQSRCLESTSIADGDRRAVFGDQRYLERWPEDFGDAIYVSPLRTEMQAPWNTEYCQRDLGVRRPVFYHFHSLRLIGAGWVQWCAGYRIGAARHLYLEYLSALREVKEWMASSGQAPATGSAGGGGLWLVRLAWRVLTGRVVLKRSI